MPILLPNKSEQGMLLSKRLSAVAESLSPNTVVCDVGSDHGALPLYLLKNNLCSKVIVSDLNLLPLKRAQKALLDGGVSECAVFCHTDGIESLLSYSPDVIVIAGMGGETIAGILSRAKKKISFGMNFVFQPMSKTIFFRQYLYENGFLITNEKLVKENKKIFLIMEAQYQEQIVRKSEDIYLVGEYLPKVKDELTREYFQQLLTKFNIRLSGKRKAGIPYIKEEKYIAVINAVMEEKYESSRR